MEINKQMLRQLENVDEAQLRQAVNVIARALGADPIRAAMASRNIEAFKEKAMSMSDEELSEAASKIPPEKAAEIMKMLGISGRDGR